MKKVTMWGSILTTIIILSGVMIAGNHINFAEFQVSIKRALAAVLSIDTTNKPIVRQLDLKISEPKKTELNNLSVAQDGRMIVYSKKEKLYVYYPEESKTLNLGLKGDHPVISADGTTLLFKRGKKLMIADLVKTGVKVIDAQFDKTNFSTQSSQSRPSISGNGKVAVFTKRFGNDMNVFLYDRDSGVVTRFRTGYSPAISHDGKNLAYYYRSKKGETQLLLAALDGSEEKLMVNDKKLKEEPVTFSRDDRFVNFSTSDQEVVYDLKTGANHRLPVQYRGDRIARLSGDGDEVILIDSKGDGSIHILNYQKNIEKILALPNTSPKDLFISSDGKRVIVEAASSGEKSTNLWIFELP